MHYLLLYYFIYIILIKCLNLFVLTTSCIYSLTTTHIYIPRLRKAPFKNTRKAERCFVVFTKYYGK